jgi:Lrp/AsnC family transcriptional regulator, leucine-responsive regulatory protein
MNERRLDPVDERILRLLVRNARASWREIGDEVGLSANAVAQRVRRLELGSWVRGYRAVLDPALEGPHSAALVMLRVRTDVDVEPLETQMLALPGVVEVLDVAGPGDYQVRVHHASQRGLYEIVNALRVLPGVEGMETRVVLREVLPRRAEVG